MDRYCTPDDCNGCPAKIVCRCLRVSEADVIEVITNLELRTIKEIRQEIGAGDGCTCCHADLAQYIEKFSCVSAAG